MGMGEVGHKGVWVGGGSRFRLEIWRDGGRMWNGGCCGETWGGAPGPPPGDSKFR